MTSPALNSYSEGRLEPAVYDAEYIKSTETRHAHFLTEQYSFHSHGSLLLPSPSRHKHAEAADEPFTGSDVVDPQQPRDTLGCG